MVTMSCSVPRGRIFSRGYQRAVNTAQSLLHPLDALIHARVVIFNLWRVKFINRCIVVLDANVGTGCCPTLLQLAESLSGKTALINAASPCVW